MKRAVANRCRNGLTLVRQPEPTTDPQRSKQATHHSKSNGRIPWKPACGYTGTLSHSKDATFYGVEGKSTVVLAGGRSAGLAALLLGDYVRAKLSDDAGNVPRIPPYHSGAGLVWHSPRWDARALAQYSGNHTDIAMLETPTAGFLNLDADVAVRPLVTVPGLELAITGTNLLNRDERNSVSFNKDVVLLPGRDVHALFRFSF